MKVAVCIPTRGVLYARTIRSTVLNPELPSNTPFIIVEGLPIPDAHNECIRRALRTNATHFLFVEEDMEIPEGGVTKMMEEAYCGHPIVVMDYFVRPNLKTTFSDGDDKIFFGFGCTMFHRSIFEEYFSDPWLTDKYDVMIERQHPFAYSIVEGKGENRYGKFDVYFGIQLREKGIPFYVIPTMMARHLRLKSWERKEVNNGAHEVYEI